MSVVVLSPGPGKLYADVLAAILKFGVLGGSGTEIWQIRKIAAGGIIIKFRQYQSQSKFYDGPRNKISH